MPKKVKVWNYPEKSRRRGIETYKRRQKAGMYKKDPVPPTYHCSMPKHLKSPNCLGESTKKHKNLYEVNVGVEVLVCDLCIKHQSKK